MSQALTFHYYTYDKSHRLDAYLLNKCDSSFLLIAEEVFKICGLAIEIEIEAIKEGGLVQKWTLLSQDTKATVVVGTAACAISTVACAISILSIVINMPDRELAELQKELFRKQIAQIDSESNGGSGDEKSKSDYPDRSDEIIENIERSPKINAQRSHYFENAEKIEKVEKIEIQQTENDRPVNDPIVIHREDFFKYIRLPETIEPIIEENVFVEIVAPVLLRKKHNWKGIREGDSFDFKMKDENFKKQVYSKAIAFRSGFAITCDIKTDRWVDEAGVVRSKTPEIIVVRKLLKEGEYEPVQQIKPKKKSAKKDDSLPLYDMHMKNAQGNS